MTSVTTIIGNLQECGFKLTLTKTGRLSIRPASRLSNEDRTLIAECLAELIAYLAVPPPGDFDRAKALAVEAEAEGIDLVEFLRVRAPELLPRRSRRRIRKEN